MNKIKLRNELYLAKQKHLQEEELNEERLYFYTNITHELRTPLTLILGPLEDLLRDNELMDKFKQKISTIHNSGERLLNLVNQLLEFRKTETFNRKLSVQKADLSLLISETTLKFAELNRNNELTIKSEIKENNYDLYFDPEIITITLDNLISNAIKHTSKGTITVKLEKTREADKDYVLIKVMDTGDGIDSESLSHIFDRYYKVKDKEHITGFGIGLSLVKSLINLHEGEIYVESTPNKGSEFCIKLKDNYNYSNALYKNADINRDLDNEGVNVNGIMLIVEDNTEIQQYIKDTFKSNFEIVLANNGQEGKQKAFEVIPDIIISDIMMPVMDGIELCKILKNDIRTSHIPIVLLTAKDTIEDKAEGYQSGVDSYITKPFSGNLIKSRIINILESRKKLASFYKGNISTKESNTPSYPFGDIDNEFITKITEYVEERISDDNINVVHMAEAFHMSQSTLYRKVKSLVGLTTTEFIRTLRIHKAQQLLLNSDYNISEVMYMVGISSPTYFRKRFKEVYGLTPTEYKKRNSKNHLSN